MRNTSLPPLTLSGAMPARVGGGPAAGRTCTVAAAAVVGEGTGASVGGAAGSGGAAGCLVPTAAAQTEPSAAAATEVTSRFDIW